MTLKKFSSLSANRFFWLNILAMAIVVLFLGVGIFKGLDLYTHHGEEVMVPDVKGMMPNQAEKLFHDRGLIAKIVNTSYRKEMPSGCILELAPEAGEKVKKGRIIFLTINSIDAPLREVPDVTENSSAREAEAQLLTAGFHLTPNQLVKGEQDWVYGVLYNGRRIMTGEKIPVGSILTLQIGNGNVDMEDEDSSTVTDDDVVLDESDNTTEPTKTDQKATKTEQNKSTKIDASKTKAEQSKIKQKPDTKTLGRQTKKMPKKKEHKSENSNDSWF